MRRAVVAAILFSVLLSAFSLSATAQSESNFYLHAGFLLDQNARTSTTPNVLKLTTGEYYVWISASFPAVQSFPSTTWVASLWMATATEPTQYRIGLGVVNSSGAFVDYAHSFTPIITEPSPSQYDVRIPAGAFNAAAGESLALGLLRQWQNGSYSPAAFIYMDSQSTPSGLRGPAIATTTTATQTTTHQTSTSSRTTIIATTTTESGIGVGWILGLVLIGAGAACAGGAVTVASSGRSYSGVFTYGGYYYCGKHRVPLYSVNGWLWCPRDRRYLSRSCRSCGNAMKQFDRFCDRCGRAIY